MTWADLAYWLSYAFVNGTAACFLAGVLLLIHGMVTAPEWNEEKEDWENGES